MKKPGKEYEEIVAAIHRQFADGAEIEEDVNLVGKSGKGRQIDLLIRGRVGAYPILVIADCKDYKRRVGIQQVDGMIGKIEDVGAVAGVIVSDSGFSDEAIARAREDGRVQLSSVVDTKRGKLRAQVLVPFVCDFRRPRMRLEVQVSTTVPFAIDSEFQAEMYNRFIERWNQGKIDAEPGDHSSLKLLEIHRNSE